MLNNKDLVELLAYGVLDWDQEIRLTEAQDRKVNMWMDRATGESMCPVDQWNPAANAFQLLAVLKGSYLNDNYEVVIEAFKEGNATPRQIVDLIIDLHYSETELRVDASIVEFWRENPDYCPHAELGVHIEEHSDSYSESEDVAYQKRTCLLCKKVAIWKRGVSKGTLTEVMEEAGFIRKSGTSSYWVKS